MFNILLCSLLAQAQFNTFPELLKKAEQEAKTETKGSKWLNRWTHHLESRLMPNGEMAPVEIYFKAAQEASATKDYARTASRASDSTWYPAGPDTLVPGRTSWSSHGVSRVNCIEFHPTDTNTFWVGASQGGIWKTSNSGKTYTPLNNNLPILRISDIEVDPNDPQTIYISVGDFAYISAGLRTDGRKRNTHYGLGVYKTTNGGQSWQATGLVYTQLQEDNSLIKRIFVNPNNSSELVAAGVTGVWKSYDGGDNWTRKLNELMWDMEKNPFNHQTLVASSGWVLNLNQGRVDIWRSEDFGENWTSAQHNLPARDSVQRVDLTIARGDTNVMYAVSCGRDRGFYSFLKSSDGGRSWQRRKFKSPNILEWGIGDRNGGQGTYDLCMIADVDDPNRVFTGGINVWGSSDGGSSWDGVSYWLRYYGFTPHADQHYMDYNPLDQHYYVCNDGGIFRTERIEIGSWDSTNFNGYEFPTKWEDVSSGMQITSFYRLGISDSSSNAVVAGAQDNGTFYKNDAGKWTNITGGDGMDCMIFNNDPEKVITTSQFGNFYATQDGGQFISYLGDLGFGENAAWTTPVEQIPDNDFNFLVGYENVFLADRFGGANRLGRLSNSNDNAVVDLAVADNKGKVIAAIKRPDFLDNQGSELYLTKDGGGNWTNKTAGLPDSLFLTCVIIDDRDHNLMWVSVGGFEDSVKVYRSEDGGNTWTNVSRNLPNIPVNMLVQDQQSLHNPIYAATDIGVYYTNDSLSDWHYYSKAFPNVIVSDLAIHRKDRKLFASTFGRGVWKVELVDTVHVFPPDTTKDPNDPDDPKEPVSVNNLHQSGEFVIYPNPSNGQFKLGYKNNAEAEISLEVIDVFGRLLDRRSVTLDDEGELPVYLDLSPGQYYLRISGIGKPKVAPFIIE